MYDSAMSYQVSNEYFLYERQNVKGSLKMKAMILKTAFLFPIGSIKFANSPGSSRPFPSYEIRDFREKSPLRTCKNERK